MFYPCGTMAGTGCQSEMHGAGLCRRSMVTASIDFGPVFPVHDEATRMIASLSLEVPQQQQTIAQDPFGMGCKPDCWQESAQKIQSALAYRATVADPHTLFIIDEEVKEARRIAHGGKPHAEAVQDAMNQLVESEVKAEKAAKHA